MTDDVFYQFAAAKLGVDIYRCEDGSWFKKRYVGAFRKSQFYIDPFDIFASGDLLLKGMNRAFIEKVEWKINTDFILMDLYSEYRSPGCPARRLSTHVEATPQEIFCKLDEIIPRMFWTCWYRLEQKANGEQKCN